MLVGVFKDIIKNSDSYIYLDYNNGYKYHGVEICNNNIKPLDKDIILNIYNSIKINDNCNYVKDYKEYKVYYDDFNNLYHYIKEDKEDLLMFFLKNGYSVSLYDNKLPTHNSNNKSFYRKIISSTSLLLVNVSLFYSLLVSNPIVTPEISTEYKTEITYIEDKLSGNELDTINVDDVIKMIHDSTRLSDSEKEFFSNTELLEDIIPYYQNTSMEYVIKTRLDDLGIIYMDLPEGISGSYAYSNEIYINKDLKNCGNENKKTVISHEFIHLLQADIPTYLKEASAEIISSEYYDFSPTSYTDACFNLRLLTETIGPKVMWSYIFSGDDNEFNSIIKNNLNTGDYQTLINELNKSPHDDNPNNELITSIIHRLYNNIYNEDITNNYDIYDFYGNYIEKNCFKPNENAFSSIIYCDKDTALNKDLVEYSPLYKFEKEINCDEFKNFINNNNSTVNYIDNTNNCGIFVKLKDSNKKVDFCNVIDNKIYVSDNDKNDIYEFTKEGLFNLFQKYNLYYYVNTDDKNYNNTYSDLELVDTSVTLKSKDKKFQCLGEQLMYKTGNIQDRFPNQIIRKKIINKNNVLN